VGGETRIEIDRGQEGQEVERKQLALSEVRDAVQAVVESGKFQGTIAATTPSGNRCTNASVSAGVGGISS